MLIMNSQAYNSMSTFLRHVPIRIGLESALEVELALEDLAGAQPSTF
jgi:hypothetical protein